MTTFQTSGRVLAITREALLFADARTLAQKVLRPDPGGMVFAAVAVFASTVYKRLHPPMLTPHLDLAQLSVAANSRAADLPASIRANPAWPRLPANTVVQIVPRSAVARITVSRWGWLKLTTDRGETRRFRTSIWRAARLRAALMRHGYAAS